MRYITCFLTLTFLFIINDITIGQAPDSTRNKSVVITTSLLDYFPNKLNSGYFNIGGEFCLKERNFLYAGAGYIKSYSPSGGWSQIAALNTSGYKVQAEGRHFLNMHKILEPAILVFWPHIFQFHSQPLPNTGYYYAVHSEFQSTRTKRESNYSVDRNAVALSMKFGYQCIKKFGLVVDYSVGLGLQYISSSPDNPSAINDDEDIPWNKTFDSGSGFYPKILYQVRVGWKL